MQCSFSKDPELGDKLFDFLDTVFPGLKGATKDIKRLGTSWESVSTPFIHFDEGRPVSHVGLIELPLILEGQRTLVGTVHAVSTDPAQRRRGHYRKIMEELLEYAGPRYETLVLTTEHPEYFEAFGFRHVKEHIFTLGCEFAGDTKAMRLLNLADDEDIALMNRLLERRQPVSHVVGVVDEKAIFCFNETHRPLYYCKELDVLVCMQLQGTTLKLFDVVGPELPDLRALLARAPGPVESVVFGFSPDRFTADARPLSGLFEHDGPSWLMVRGPLTVEKKRFVIPRSART